MKRINLLPKTEQNELKLQVFSDRLILFWIWAIISVVFFVALTYTAKIYLEGQRTETESQIEVEKQILRSSDNEQLKRQVESLNAQINSIRNLQAQHYYWSQALNELARIIPTDMSVDLLTAERASGKVTMSGISKTRDSVLNFWAEMHKSEYFKGIDFPLANLNSAENDPFSFSFFIVPETLRNP
ncbi:MAG: PilN domain-containing protein [Candidatus Doudnabacteria bacterium]|nr:PilN domain-containing protein [Candidatus Doudnabacteria bacterium]